MLEMFALTVQDTLYFALVVISLAIVMYIVVRVVLYVVRKRHPGKHISFLLWKRKVKHDKSAVSTVEDVYKSVLESLRMEGKLDKKDKGGMLSRKKVMTHMPDGEKKMLLQNLFGLYEAKVYGNRRIQNEAKVVAGILDRYASL